MQKIAGCTKTETDPAIVRGWKVMRTATNDVEIRWKLDPGQDDFRKGVDGTATSAGFRIYASQPANFPEPVAPQQEILKPAYLKQLKTTHMKELHNSCSRASSGTKKVPPRMPATPLCQWSQPKKKSQKVSGASCIWLEQSRENKAGFGRSTVFSGEQQEPPC